MGLQEYTQHQLSFRPAGDAARIRVEWTSKSQKEKVQWTKAFKIMQAQEDKLVTDQQDLDNARAALDNEYTNNTIIISSGDDYWNFIDRLQTLKERYNDMTKPFRVYAKYVRRLIDVENGQAGRSQVSLNFLRQERREAFRSIRRNMARKIALDIMLGTPPMAQDPQGRPRMPDNWLPFGRQGWVFRHGIDRDRGHHLIKAEGTLGQTWRCAGAVGGGQSMGTVWLRFEEDEDGEFELTDRVFRKDCLVDQARWFDPTKFEGDVRSLNNKIPVEIAITNDIANTTNTIYSVRPREPFATRHVDNNLCTYRLYLEYLNRGNLGDMIEEHKSQDTQIKEPFVWYVAEALSIAGLAMANGAVPAESGNSAVPAAWDEIVHRDLKPYNVFLEGFPEDSKPAIWPHYARPVLGDYGLAVRTNAQDVFNPHWYNLRSGTNGFLPPEQGRHIDARSKILIDEFRLGEKTNVYGVGLILWCMIMKTNSPPDRYWLGDPNLDATLNIPAAEQVKWSAQLMGLVRDCLRYDPATRPTFAQVLMRVRTATNELPGGLNLSQNMRAGTVPPTVFNMPIFPNEKYTFGLTPSRAGVESI